MIKPSTKVVAPARPPSFDRREAAWPIAGGLLSAWTVWAWDGPAIAKWEIRCAWLATMGLVSVCGGSQAGTRAAAFIAGWMLGFPALVAATPIWRGMMMCVMAVPLVAATALVTHGPIATLRGRLVYFMTWGGSREIARRPPRFHTKAALHLAAGTCILAGAIWLVKTIPGEGAWLIARWVFGAIMALAFAEMATWAPDFVSSTFGVTSEAYMRSPHLSTSVADFWNKRWNVFASEKAFKPLCFEPLARHGIWPGLIAAFGASAVAHVVIAYAATGRWGLSLACGLFFIAQLPLIWLERRMNVRRWPKAKARLWTYGAMGLVAPLFLEPVLQVIEKAWAGPGSVWWPTLAALQFLLTVCLVLALGTFLATTPARLSKSKTPSEEGAC